ncbi:MAG: hypothetical protein M3O50_04940 [Myxococcota bacterium]|nr:hypothetical protein [Myxococcota bacterium]
MGTASAATAPLGWDVAAEVGIAKSFPTGNAPGAPNPGLGPVFELQAHVALLPMVRLGVYVAQDLSPASGVGARQFWTGGLHLKGIPPILAPPWRVWLFAGCGYAWTHAPPYTIQEPLVAGAPETGDVRIGGVSGGLLEAPLGVGVGYRVRRPWELFAELGARLRLAFWGAMYAGGATGPGTDATGTAQPFMGKDSFALSLSLGLSFAE